MDPTSVRNLRDGDRGVRARRLSGHQQPIDIEAATAKQHDLPSTRG
jgi:hypothetical protein